MNAADADWGGYQWGGYGQQEEISMGGSLEGNGQEVLEVAKPPGVEAVQEGGIWKVVPRDQTLGDFVQVMNRKTSQRQREEQKKSKFCEGYACGVPHCGELHMVRPSAAKCCDMLMREEAQTFKDKGGINTTGRKSRAV